MPENNVTLDELARMVKEGLDHVDERFDQVEHSLKRIENAILADHQRRIERIEEALAVPTAR